MAVIERGNWCFRDPGDDIPDGSTINGGNFLQAAPGTEILAGKTLTINDGNFTNVAQDPAWTINGGTWNQISYCANHHADWVELGWLEPEMDYTDPQHPVMLVNCPHVTETVELVGGETIYVYEDTAQ